MRPYWGDVVEGINTFVDRVKIIPGPARISVVVFNTIIQTPAIWVPIESFNPWIIKAYSPDGMTALIDSACEVIDTEGRRYAEMSDSERPTSVSMLIYTDGEENSSKRYTRDDLRQRIEHQRNVWQWDISFAAANLDAFAEARSLGIDQDNTINAAHTSKGTSSVFAAYAVSQNLGDQNTFSGMKTYANARTFKDVYAAETGDS